MSNSIFAKKVAGKLSFNAHQFFAFKDGQTFDITPREPKRSLGQNAMFHAWLDKCAASTGNNSTELKEYLIETLAPRTVVIIKGTNGRTHEKEVTVRTSQMDKMQMGDFMDACAAHTGYPLPSSKELEAMGYIHN